MALSQHAKVGYVEKKGEVYYLRFTTNTTLTSTALSTKEYYLQLSTKEYYLQLSTKEYYLQLSTKGELYV